MAEQDEPGRAPRRGLFKVDPATQAETPTRYGGVTVREYFADDLDGALDAWGKLDARPSLRDRVTRIVSDLASAEETAVFEVYVQGGRQSVGIVFASAPGVPAAIVTTTHVDHRTHLPGATSGGLDGMWRTTLTATASSARATAARGAASRAPRPSTSRAPRTPKAPPRPAPPAMVPCPTCFELVPRAGECRCGWRPEG